jgi:hypothetical protein
MMTIKSPEFLREYIRVHHDLVSHAETCRRFSIDQSTVFVWLRASKAAAERKDDPSEWIVEIDGERRYFHQFCKRAFDDCLEAIAANAFVRARDGFTTTATYRGQTCYKLNPDWLDVGMRELLGLGDGDMYLRDARGNLVAETITTAPSTDLVAFLLSSHHPKRYGKKSSIDMNVNSRISGGVQIVGGPRQAQIQAPLPVLDVIATEVSEPEPALTDEPEDGLDLSVRDTDPDAETTATVDEPEAPAPVDPGPMISDAGSLKNFSPGPNPLIRKLTDAERAALARLPSSLNRGR